MNYKEEEKTEWAIENWKSRDTGSIGHKTQTEDNKTQNTKQKTKTTNNTHHTEVNQVVAYGKQFVYIYTSAVLLVGLKSGKSVIDGFKPVYIICNCCFPTKQTVIINE